MPHLTRWQSSLLCPRMEIPSPIDFTTGQVLTKLSILIQLDILSVDHPFPVQKMTAFPAYRKIFKALHQDFSSHRVVDTHSTWFNLHFAPFWTRTMSTETFKKVKTGHKSFLQFRRMLPPDLFPPSNHHCALQPHFSVKGLLNHEPRERLLQVST